MFGWYQETSMQPRCRVKLLRTVDERVDAASTLVTADAELAESASSIWRLGLGSRAAVPSR